MDREDLILFAAIVAAVLFALADLSLIDGEDEAFRPVAVDERVASDLR